MSAPSKILATVPRYGLVVYNLPDLVNEFRHLASTEVELDFDGLADVTTGILFMRTVLGECSQYLCGICRTISFGCVTNSVEISRRVPFSFLIGCGSPLVAFDRNAAVGNRLAVCSSCYVAICTRRTPVHYWPPHYSNKTVLKDLTVMERALLSLMPAFRIRLTFVDGMVTVDILPTSKREIASEFPLSMTTLAAMTSCHFIGPVKKLHFKSLYLSKRRLRRAVDEMINLEPNRLSCLYSSRNLDDVTCEDEVPSFIVDALNIQLRNPTSSINEALYYNRGPCIPFDPMLVAAPLFPRFSADFHCYSTPSFPLTVRHYLCSSALQYGCDPIFSSYAFKTNQELVLSQSLPVDQTLRNIGTWENFYSIALQVFREVPGGECLSDLSSSKVHGMVARFGYPTFRFEFNNWRTFSSLSRMDPDSRLVGLMQTLTARFADNPYLKSDSSAVNNVHFFCGNVAAVIANVVGWNGVSGSSSAVFGTVDAFLYKVRPGPGGNIGAVFLLWSQSLSSRAKFCDALCDDSCPSKKFGRCLCNKALSTYLKCFHEVHFLGDSNAVEASDQQLSAVQDFYRTDSSQPTLMEIVRDVARYIQDKWKFPAGVEDIGMRTIIEKTLAAIYPSSIEQCYMMTMPTFMADYANRSDDWSGYSLYGYMVTFSQSTAYLPHMAVLTDDTAYAAASGIHGAQQCTTGRQYQRENKVYLELDGDINRIREIGVQRRALLYLFLFKSWRMPADVVGVGNGPEAWKETFIQSVHRTGGWYDMYTGLDRISAVNRRPS